MSFKSRFSPIALSQIRLTDPFWVGWQKTLRESTLRAEYDQLVQTERLAHFRRAAGKEEGKFTGYYFNDSDVYKWLEACSYVLAQGPAPEIEQMVEEAIALIADAQEEDGYIDTFFQLNHPNLKFRNLVAMHELYCAGHLYEAAVAHFQATGKRNLLDVAIKSADLMVKTFGTGGRRGYCGHEEIELALIKLGQATGKHEYVELARRMVEERGKTPTAFAHEFEDDEAMAISKWVLSELNPGGVYKGEYAQDHAPIRDHTEVVGHAVRAMYLYMAATDLADGKNDDALESTLQRMWANLTQRRMYVTGGIGPSGKNEGFTTDYDLPNLTAYAETCASIGLVLWGNRLLRQTGNSEYADIVERALYNGSLSGISVSGDRFFYTNPLESRGEHERVPWFGCACCPPNIARVIGSVSDLVAGVSEDAVWINIPAGFEAETSFHGERVKIKSVSNYPWSGKFEIHVDPDRPVEFGLRVRIPGWAGDATFDLAGSNSAATFDEGYAVFHRTWKPGDVLKVDLEMEPKWVRSSLKVYDNLGRACLTYGPLVYCLEEHDLGGLPQFFTADVDAEATPEAKPDKLGGIISLQVEGVMDSAEDNGELYADADAFSLTPQTAEFIPFYAWCNRGPNHMQVWVRSI